MRVCYVSAYYDGASSSGIDVISNNYTMREFAEQVAALGHEVDVVHLFHSEERVLQNQVTYHFVRPARALTTLASLATRLRPGRAAAHYLPGTAILRTITSVRPDIIHFFGLTLDINLWLVARYASRRRIPLVVQYHGGEPARSRVRRVIQRDNLRKGSCFLFTTPLHAQPWIDARMPLDARKVVPFMETSSTFSWQPREQARAQSGMSGEPVFLWTGRLHSEKGPMLAVRGFERIRQHWPGAQLYMYYLTDELLPELQSFTLSRPGLDDSVHFRGRAPYSEMQSIYNSADFFLQASTRETSGCAVLEAMSCGAIPVVSDIPSFRMMLQDGHYGILFPAGDVDALVNGVLSVPLDTIDTVSGTVRARWMNALSFPVLAQQLDLIYQDVAESEPRH